MNKPGVLQPSIFGTSYYSHEGEGPYVRVTMTQSIIMNPGLIAWYKRSTEDQIQERLDTTSEMGTKIHHYIEEYLRGNEVIIEEWAIPAMSHFTEYAESRKLHPVELEKTMLCSNLGLGGTCDYMDDTKLIDWKTGQVSEKNFCQIALYMYMVWEATGKIYKDLRVVGIHRDGKKPVEKICPDPLGYLRAALLAFERWKWENRDRLRWAGAPLELYNKRKISRGANRRKFNLQWHPDFEWPWLSKDSLQKFEEFAILYKSTKQED